VRLFLPANFIFPCNWWADNYHTPKDTYFARAQESTIFTIYDVEEALKKETPPE
jgi:hypothetical protein